MKFIKYALIGLISLISFAVAAIYGLLLFVDTQQIKTLASEQVQKHTGRSLLINGDIKPSFSLIPTITISQISIGNPAWAQHKTLIEAQEMSVSLAIIPLLSGSVELRDIALSDASVNLEINAKGQQSWDFSLNADDTGKPAQDAHTDSDADKGDDKSAGFSINSVAISNSTITYSDARDGSSHSIVLRELSAEDIGASHVGEVNATGSYNNVPFSVSGRMEKELLIVEARLQNDAASATLNASVSLVDSAYDATVKADAKTLSDLLALVGQQADDANAVSVSATFGGTQDIITITALDAQYGALQAHGNGKVNLAGAKPYIQLNVKSDSADTAAFNRAEPQPTNGEVTTTEPSAPSQQALPLKELKSVNADVTLAIGSLKLDTVSLKNVKATAALKNGMLTVNPLTFDTSDGAVQANAILNAASDIPQLNVSILADNVILGQLLNEIDGQNDMTGGHTKGMVELNAQGKTLDALLQSSTGKLNFYVKELVYAKPPKLAQGADFIAVLRGKNADSQAITVQCGVGQFAITDGIARVETLAFKTDGAVVNGSGSANLPKQTLDIALKAQSDFVGFADVVPPLKLYGPWVNPDVTLDTASSLIGIGKLVLGSATGVGLVAILGEQVTNKLGITAETDPCLQSIVAADQQAEEAQKDPKSAYKAAEDNVRAIRDDIKDNVKDELKNLKEDYKKTEDDVRAIRDGLKGLIK